MAAEAPAPSAPYLSTILGGLTDELLDLDAAIAYVLAADGVGLLWDDASVTALMSRTATGSVPAGERARRAPGKGWKP
jgi:hypothetical protein